MFLLKRRNFAKCGYTGWQDVVRVPVGLPEILFGSGAGGRSEMLSRQSVDKTKPAKRMKTKKAGKSGSNTRNQRLTQQGTITEKP